MCQENYNTNKRKFKQLTYKDRVKIETLYNDQHLSYTQIGKILGEHRTTISRDIKLGLVELETSKIIWYNDKTSFSNKYNALDEFRNDYKKYFENKKKILIDFQTKLRNIIDIIYNLHENDTISAGNFKERFNLLLSINYDKAFENKGQFEKIDGIIYRKKTISIDNIDKNDIFKLYNEKNDYLYQVFTSKNIEAICIIELDEITKNENTEIKICQHCGRYFIPNTRKSEIYCTLPNDDGKTCSEKGVKETYNNKIFEDDVLLEYKRAYQRKMTKIYRASDDEKEKLKEDFYNWKKQAREIIKKYKNNEIKSNVALKWLTENK